MGKRSAASGKMRRPAAPAWRLPDDWLWGAILVAAVVVTYTSVWSAGYVWDDDIHLTKNPCVVGPYGLTQIWTTAAADVCPFTLTTFWLEYHLWGLAPFPYHLVTVLLHAACAILLWRVLRSLEIPGAWLGAALWALHPLQVESVAWITEMKNTESGVFFLLSSLFYIKDLRSRGTKSGTTREFVLSLVFAALAMATKSSAVILPFALGLCAWWIDRGWSWQRLFKLAPYFLLALAAGLASMLSVHQTGLDSNIYEPRSWPERFAVAGDALWFYLGKMIWPFPLMAIEPRWTIDTGNLLSYLPLAAAAALGLLVGLRRNSGARPLFFAFGYYIAALLPVLGFVDLYPIHLSFVFYHFQYLAGMGPLALVGAGMSLSAKRRNPLQQKWLWTAAALVLALLGGVSWSRAWVYQNEDTLWTDALAKNPHCWAAYNNLGDSLRGKGQLDQAVDYFHKAIELNPKYYEAYDNLALTLVKKGEADEATAMFEKSLQIKPAYVRGLNDYAGFLAAQGKLPKALALYQEVLRIGPQYYPALNNIGLLLLTMGRSDEAMADFQQVLSMDPKDEAAHHNLANAYAQKGNWSAAIDEYRAAAAINPRDPDVHASLGNALLQTGQTETAVQEYQQALTLKPDLTQAENNLAFIYLQQGRIDEAVALMRAVAAKNPDDPQAHGNLAVALFRQGAWQQAIDEFQTTLRLKPGDPTAQDGLAQARQKLSGSP